MDEPIYLLEPLLSIKVRNEKFHLLLKACNEQQALACKSEIKVRSVVSTVNARLNELGHRSSGIQLLRTLLAQCSDSVFVENSVSWMTQCLRAAANEQSADEACGVLCLLIEMSHHFQELTKPVSGQIIPKLLDHLLKLKKSAAALQCLEAVLHYYPGPCKAKAKIVEKFLLMFVDEEDRALVEYASRCMCYLPLLLTKGSNDSSTWTNVLTELCATASSLMFELFENVHEVAVPPALTELPVGFKLKTLKIDSPLLSLHHVATRLINIFTFINGMLLGELPNVKAIRDDLLIALAYRVLAVNCNMVSRGKTMDHVALVCVLPDIHVAVLNLLQSLVSCCNGGLMKYGPLFCKLVLQTLKWTKVSSGYGVERPFRHLREVSYKFLESWITRAKAASCVELVCEDLITQMLQDVYQKKDAVTLQFQEKGKTSLQKQMLQIRQQLADPKVNFGPCEAALRALSVIIESSGTLLGPTLHMRLQEVVVTLLLNIQLSSGPKEMPAPYSVTGCRMQLYRLLLALTLHPHPRWPPPTQFSLVLFSQGQNDCSLEVAGFCNLAVACTRQMVHPSQSSHQFPISVDEMRASVGLPNLETVRGLNLNIQNGQNKIAIQETDPSDLASRTFSPEETQLTPLPKDSVQKNIFQSRSSDKVPKKKPHTSFNEVSLNGIESSPNNSGNTSKFPKKKCQLLSVSNHDTKSNTVSDKPNKKKQHLQFTVKELVTSADKSTTSKRGRDWEVTDVMEVNEKPIEKESAKSSKVHETSVGTKRLHNSPKDIDERPKIRKLNESPSKPDGLINEIPSENSPCSNTAGNSETSIDVKQSVTINDTTEKESNGCVIIEVKNVQEKMLELEGTKEDMRIGVVEMEECENGKRESEDSSPNKDDNLPNQSPLNNPKYRSNDYIGKVQVISPVTKSPEDKSNDYIAKGKVEVGSPVKKSPEASDCKFEKVNSPKVADPVVELLLSSDSETEQRKRASGVYRRITRSIAKRTSTPYRNPEQRVCIEELPSSHESFTTEMLKDISRLEEESVSADIDPSVELAESDESAPLVLRIESDRESVEIFDVTNDKIDYQGSVVKEKSETIDSAKETSTSGNSNTPSSKKLKDSMTSDREIEEVSEEMEAVVDSPDVTIEEVSACSDKENTDKKLSKETEEDGSGSETNEEEILASFVDALQPKSE